MSNGRLAALVVLTLVVGIGLGALLFSDDETSTGAEPTHADTHDEDDVDFWTCSMHPQVKLPGPGLCPICHMELIPVTSTSGADAPFVLRASEKGVAGIETTIVERKPARARLELTGRITVDETRVARVSAPASGRVERLFVDVTGTRVREGDHLLVLWSRELMLVQKEFVDAVVRAEQQPEGSAARRVLLDAARSAEDRLSLFGMTKGELDTLKRERIARDRLTLNAPKGGVVIARDVLPGAYVEEGTPLYTVADLSRVWVEIDVFEADLPHVAEGQRVVVEPFGVVGEPHEARVVLVSPVVDAMRRAVRVRADLTNANGALKPGMLVRARIESEIDAAGHVVVTHDATHGAWTCPMHPEVSRRGPGECPVCGMPLERRARTSKDIAAPLVIPVDAPLLTGRRAVVYVEYPDAEGARYEGREVVLGPRTDEGYVVVSGLAEGERIVTRGAFKIDAAMQIEARPSMLAPKGLSQGPASHVEHRDGTPASTADAATNAPPTTTSAAPAPTAPGDDARHPRFGALVRGYLDVERALTEDDHARAASAASALTDTVAQKLPSPVARRRADLTASTTAIASSTDVKTARAAFVGLSELVIALVEQVGVPTDAPLYVQFCPMANGGKGARWLEVEQAISNPYFGQKMLRCGETRATLAPNGGAP